jgi:hypothetical protein
MANQPIPARHPDLDQEPEAAPAKPVKRSPLYGISRTRIISLDKGLPKTLMSALQRWNKNRIEFIESLPEETREELRIDGILEPPTFSMPSLKPPAPPTPPAPARRPEPMTGLAGARVNGVAGYRG